MRKIIKILLFAFTFTMLLNAVTFTYGYYRDYDYPYIYDAHFSYKTARWSVSGQADKFEVVLYRNGRRVATHITYSRNYNFDYDMSFTGYDYYFEVRPYNYRTGWGSWVSSNYVYNDDCYRDYRYDYRRDRYDRYDRNYYGGDISYSVNQGPPYENQANISNGYSISNSGLPNIGGTANYSNNNVQSVIVPEPQIINDTINGIIPTGSFMQVMGSWKYAYINGAFATNTWIKSKGKWYYIDINGNMVTGPYSINGKTYYFNTDGSMVVGNINIAGVNHYFGADGVMVY